MDEAMPVYPGTETPVFATGCTLEHDGFREKKMTLYSHTGTHMDAPSHLLPDGPSLDDLPVDHFAGKAVLLDAAGAEGSVIGLRAVKEIGASLGPADYLLIRTGWSRYWGSRDYFGRFPVLSRDAARALADAGLKGVGFDCISADAMDDPALPNHRILLGAGLVIIENLRSLDALPPQGCLFAAYPLKIKGADGSPVRAVGIME